MQRLILISPDPQLAADHLDWVYHINCCMLDALASACKPDKYTCKSLHPPFHTSATPFSYEEPAPRWMLSGQTREYDVHGLHPMLRPKTSDWGLQQKTNPGCNTHYVQPVQSFKKKKKAFAGSI